MTGEFSGVGTLQFTPDNKFAFIYSGQQTVTATPSDLLIFTNNSEYLVAEFKVQQATPAAEGDDCLVNIYFNDILLLGYVMGKNAFQEFDPSGITPTKLIVPPFTSVRVEMDNLSGGEATMCVIVTAKVGGAIEQENLESITDNNKWASL